ncbi:F510_1955 family glycosylhydrolase [Arthrobacter sp. UYEF20]|uniref:F510_1955 family glycosylhydrolase n=1 Tax=Arthrobacter sp. UYEF20 TaxID=1756363 RepID=UPI003393D1BE
MPFPPKTLSRAATMMTGAATLVLALVSCTPAPDRPADTSSPRQAASDLPSTHIHGLSVSGDTSQVLLATHDGLFDVTKKPASKIGGTNDLMGFTGGKDHGVFYASGHPGAGSDLPNPLGLIRSVDGGKTWEQLSRQGESDFHALTTTKSGIVAFDGTLRATPDGKTWKTVAAAFAPAALAGHPDSDTVLATTPEGIRRSTDGGNTWEPVKSGPVIQFATFASPAEAAGVEPDGTVHYSADAGATWTRKGRIDGEVQAIAAVKGADGHPWIWAATADGIVVSTDGGTTFRPSDAS